MVENVIKTFKLNYNGTFDEIAYENIKDVFTIVNILAIYIQKIKTMYIWIGRNATQALKNHITQIRVLLKEEFPDFRIIRNITFEMRSEPYEFFKNLNITKDELYEIINYQEKTVVPILEKIEKLKEQSEQSIESEKYKNAINTLKEIIKLAEKVQDDAIITEQKNLILELTEKFDNQQIISEIEQETIRIEKVYNSLIREKNLLSAHELIETFIRKYETRYEISLIPSAKKLILKEERKWKAEQEKLLNDLSILEKDFKISLEKLEISEANKIYEQALNLISNLIDKKVNNRWKGFSNKIQEAKNKIDFIKKYDNFSKELNKLKEVYLYNEIKSKLEILIKQVETINLPEYRDKLNILFKEINSAEERYHRILEEIGNLENEIIRNQEGKQLEKNLRDCEKIIELGESINNYEIINKYSRVLDQTKDQFKHREEFEEKQNELKNELKKLELDFTSNLKIMEISTLNKILEKGRGLLQKLIDDEFEKNWDRLNDKFQKAKHLLKNIEFLSKKGMDALNKGSSIDSLNFFDQIIEQLQRYEV